MSTKTPAIILAAGRGTRLGCTNKNKVMLELNSKPMIAYSIERLGNSGFSPLIVVVGFAKEGIMNYFGNSVLYAVQDKRLGTADAAKKGVELLPKSAQTVLIVNGDDSYNYSEQLLQQLVAQHEKSKSVITLLTIEKDDPTGLGRILRNSTGDIIGIVEEKDATEKQRRITEVNPQCWMFSVKFLKSNLPKVKKSIVTNEYYMTDLIELAVKNSKKVSAFKAGKLAWRGVNKPEELKQAEKIIQYHG